MIWSNNHSLSINILSVDYQSTNVLYLRLGFYSNKVIEMVTLETTITNQVQKHVSLKDQMTKIKHLTFVSPVFTNFTRQRLLNRQDFWRYLQCCLIRGFDIHSDPHFLSALTASRRALSLSALPSLFSHRLRLALGRPVSWESNINWRRSKAIKCFSRCDTLGSSLWITAGRHTRRDGL